VHTAEKALTLPVASRVTTTFFDPITIPPPRGTSDTGVSNAPAELDGAPYAFAVAPDVAFAAPVLRALT
jgi:hypothetical protein